MELLNNLELKIGSKIKTILETNITVYTRLYNTNNTKILNQITKYINFYKQNDHEYYTSLIQKHTDIRKKDITFQYQDKIKSANSTNSNVSKTREILDILHFIHEEINEELMILHYLVYATQKKNDLSTKSEQEFTRAVDTIFEDILESIKVKISYSFNHRTKY